MIYTITFNPAIDYEMCMENEIQIGVTNRSKAERISCGGKGINESIVLTNLGVETITLGFVAGFVGEQICAMVEDAGVQSDFIRLPEGNSRINVKIKGKRETEINAQGPYIDVESLERLFQKLEQLKNGDYLVLAGSIPDSLPANIYEQILARLCKKQIVMVVDAAGELLLNVLKYNPFLIKPNKQELEEIFKISLKNDVKILDCAKKLQQQGAKNVLVSMGSSGAMLLTETGAVHKIGIIPGEVKNAVGAGDSMVAGFLAGYQKTGDYNYALKMGTAAANATAFSDGLAEAKEVFRLLEELSD